MSLLVQKFGGTSVADPDRIRQVADHVALLHEGRFVFIGTMDELYASDHPVVREFVEEDLIRFEKAKELV